MDKKFNDKLKEHKMMDCSGELIGEGWKIVVNTVKENRGISPEELIEKIEENLQEKMDSQFTCPMCREVFDKTDCADECKETALYYCKECWDK